MQPALAAQIPRGIAIAAYARGIKRQWFDPGVEHACYFSSVVGWHGTFSPRFILANVRGLHVE
jgi:hypothetical protein